MPVVGPIVKVHFLGNGRTAREAVDYITDDDKALGQRYWNLPSSTTEAAHILERERWRSARERCLLHLVLAFPDGASVDVASAFAYLRELLSDANLAAQPAMAAAHAGRPHLHCILSRVDPRGRLLPVRIHELVARNRDLAARYAWPGTRDRERHLPADVVNAETWEGQLSFTRYLRGLPWPQATDPDASRAVDALLARVGVGRARTSAGWRLERSAQGHTYRAKASVAMPAPLRRVLLDPVPTGVEVEPSLTYEALRARGTLVLPHVRTHERYPRAQVENARSAKGLGYWLRRMQPIPPTWTQEDRTPMIVLTRPVTGGPWRCLTGVDDTASLAELARRLGAAPLGFLDSSDPDHHFIVAPNPLAARVLAALTDQHASMPLHNGLTVALGGTLDAPLAPEWSPGNDDDPRYQLTAGTHKPFRISLDAPWSHHGPWLVLTAASQNSLLARATEIWNRPEQLPPIALQRLYALTQNMAPVDRASERLEPRTGQARSTPDDVLQDSRRALQAHSLRVYEIEMEHDGDSPSQPRTVHTMVARDEGGAREWMKDDAEPYEYPGKTLSERAATAEDLAAFVESRFYHGSPNAVREALSLMGEFSEAAMRRKERERQHTPSTHPSRRPVHDSSAHDVIAASDASMAQTSRSDRQNPPEVIAPAEHNENHQQQAPDIIAPAAYPADATDAASKAAPNRAPRNGAHRAGTRDPGDGTARVGALPEGAEPLLGLWEAYLRGLNLSEERIEQLLMTQRDAIAARAAALSSMHRLGATDFANRLRAISELAPTLTLSDANLAIARAEAGVPLLDPAHFSFAPPEEFRDAVRALPTRTALGLQQGSSVLGMRALALHNLAPAALVTLPNPDDPRGTSFNGFAVADGNTRATTTVLYDPQRGYVFDRSAPAYAQDALRYAILLAATQDDGAITLSGSQAFKERVAHLAVELGISVTNDRNRIARMEQEARMRHAHHPTTRSLEGDQRARAAAHDLGVNALDPKTCEDQRLTIVAVGSATDSNTLTIATTSTGDLLAAPLPTDQKLKLEAGMTIDVSRRDGHLILTNADRQGARDERDRDDTFTDDRDDERHERHRQLTRER